MLTIKNIDKLMGISVIANNTPTLWFVIDVRVGYDYYEIIMQKKVMFGHDTVTIRLDRYKGIDGMYWMASTSLAVSPIVHLGIQHLDNMNAMLDGIKDIVEAHK